MCDIIKITNYHDVNFYCYNTALHLMPDSQLQILARTNHQQVLCKYVENNCILLLVLTKNCGCNSSVRTNRQYMPSIMR